MCVLIAMFSLWEAELLSAKAGIDMVVIVLIDAKLASIASAFRYIKGDSHY